MVQINHVREVVSLKSIRLEINRGCSAIEETDKSNLDQAYRVGKLIGKTRIEVKRLGENWKEWAKDNLDKSYNTLQGYFRITKHWTEVKDCSSIAEALEKIREMVEEAERLEAAKEARNNGVDEPDNPTEADVNNDGEAPDESDTNRIRMIRLLLLR